MDLALAETFVAVADTGSITAAARKVHISQPALSRRLQQLEVELNAQLLTRGRQGAQLTGAGRLVVADCRALLARYDAMRRDLEEYLGIRRGTVILGGGATATSSLLPAAIANFRADHPGIRFLLHEAGSQQVAEDVAAGQVQVGVVTAPVANADVVSAPLLDDEIVLVARHDDPLPSRATANDLRGRGLVAFEANSAIRRIVDVALARLGAEVEVTMELRSVPTMLNMVAVTGDLALVSRLSLAPDSNLRVVPVRGLKIVRTLAVATRRGVPLTPAAQGFLGSLHRSVSRLPATSL